MSFIADKFKGGYAPLQDFGYVDRDIGEDLRSAAVVVRVLGRKTELGDIGHYELDADATGSMVGSISWPKNDRRENAWNYAFASLAIDDPEIVVTGGAKNIKKRLGDILVAPILDKSLLADQTLGLISPAVAPTGRKLPIGTVGITLAGTETRSQEEIFFPIDSRLVAVNHAGDPAGASVVFDLTEDNEIDVERGARLHSMMRVARVKYPFTVKVPAGVLSIFNPTFLESDLLEEDFFQNAIAWQVGPTGQDAIAGLGLVCDGTNQFDSPRLRDVTPELVTYACAGMSMGGPFDVGSNIDIEDPHKIGETKDGEAINAMHFSTDTLFRHVLLGGVQHPALPSILDAPLEFQVRIPYSRPPCFPFKVRTHLRPDYTVTHPFFGKDIPGLFRWESETPWGLIECRQRTGVQRQGGKGKPKTEDQPDVFTGAPIPFRTRIGDTDGDGFTVQDLGESSFGSVDAAPVLGRENDPFNLPEVSQVDEPQEFAQKDVDEEPRLLIYTPIDIAMNAFMARPNDCVEGDDIRNLTCPPEETLKALEEITPVTGRWEAFGGFNASGPVYTTDPGELFCGGTGPGGFAFMSPELDMADIVDNFNPGDRTRSTARNVYTPGSRLAFGVPNCVTGGLTSGIDMQINDFNELIIDGDGAIFIENDTNVSITPGGNLTLSPTGNWTSDVGGNRSETTVGSWTSETAGSVALISGGGSNFGITSGGDASIDVTGGYTETIDEGKTIDVTGDILETVSGDKIQDVAGTNTLTGGTTDLDSKVRLSQATTAIFAVDQDNLPLANANIIRLRSSANISISGFDSAGNTRREVQLINVDSNKIDILNDNAGSLAANRVITGTGNKVTLQANDSMRMIQDPTTNRWRLVT